MAGEGPRRDTNAHRFGCARRDGGPARATTGQRFGSRVPPGRVTGIRCILPVQPSRSASVRPHFSSCALPWQPCDAQVRLAWVLPEPGVGWLCEERRRGHPSVDGYAFGAAPSRHLKVRLIFHVLARRFSDQVEVTHLHPGRGGSLTHPVGGRVGGAGVIHPRLVEAPADRVTRKGLGLWCVRLALGRPAVAAVRPGPVRSVGCLDVFRPPLRVIGAPPVTTPRCRLLA